MKTITIAIICIITGLGFSRCDKNGGKKDNVNILAFDKTGRTEILFNTGWLFYRGDTAEAEKVEFNDKSWRLLDLPHDWSIEDIPGTDSPFDPDAIGGLDAGYLVGGTGWYRKLFKVPGDISKKRISLLFDGIYMNADIWLNGEHLGNHPYGYTGFSYDITEHILPGKVNVLAVRVKNEGHNSRWYSGSGIYRNVSITVTEQLYVGQWGTYITTPLVDEEKTMVKINTSVFNKTGVNHEVQLLTKILDKTGNQVAVVKTIKAIPANDNYTFEQNLELLSPMLWSVELPTLYTAVTEVYTVSDEKEFPLIDKAQTRFGIRYFSMNTKDGFLFNGKPLELKGGCMHHDNGPLGAAAFNRAEERRVELMKASGFNAIRCAHNPPSTAFLDACDRLGMLVIDEAFDMWKEAKNPQDYHLYFDDWWQKDIESMVLRDRNHPSVIFWSIGNEIIERGKPEGVALARKLSDYIRTLDPTRPVTSAVNSLNPDKDPYFATLDIGGYNYGKDNYVGDAKRLPDRIMYAAESLPLEAFDYWMGVLDYPWVIGDFVWTGFDYLGEASIGWLGYPHEGSFYPWNHAYCGDIDICGIKRPQSYYRDILWKNGNQVSLFVKPPVPSFEINPKKEPWSKWEWQDVVAHWNWEKFVNEKLEIEVYSSCEKVELFLNGKSLGIKKTSRENRWIANYKTDWQPGVLRAVGYENSKEIAASELVTAETPAKIMMTADRNEILADGQDLSYINVELLDTNGRRNPLAENSVKFEIEGPGSIIAVGSSNPRSTESFKRPERKAYQGRCLVIVRSTSGTGEIKLKATSDGLEPAEIGFSSVGESK